MDNHNIKNVINEVLFENQEWFKEHTPDDIMMVGFDADQDVTVENAQVRTGRRSALIESMSAGAPQDMREHVSKHAHNTVLVLLMREGDPISVVVVPLQELKVMDLTPIGSA